MNIEKEIRDALSDMSAVTTLVSTRIWDEWFRSDTYPAIVIEVDNEEQQNIIDGTGEVFIADINIICRADTRKASRSLAEAVRLNGTDPGTGLAGYDGEFKAALLDRVPVATPKGEGSNAYWYDTNLGFRVVWSEDD